MINDPKVLSLLELLAENKVPALEPVFAPASGRLGKLSGGGKPFGR